ncbi:galactokinase [Melissococcus plutonius]|uniref:Galactokinase n=4 Tax=Melissococcus plutonius TaxID=33970 RepID=A0A2Z5Y3P3_9ENTE|nr:galactokinase [Melissococcus plutonius]BAL62529.1 galactokinase [Melissococcus plutonius DAT561]MCV2499012.1 galactokinase [Melissococcus plutonius]MCV2500210.1 galactokinase [Melissococcus plutonius]MCV2504148.1 galactokinase [Melissococcus plutonius]MCV2507615.1 galactokinase [Melissococcus plutonius]
MKEKLGGLFKQIFDEAPEGIYFSPGRINLIGEHTDYNGGHVFPAAITIGTYGAARKRQDNQLRFYSENFPQLGIIQSNLDELVYKKEDDWANYPKGVLKYLKEKYPQLTFGMDILFCGDIPNGAGLSSSASIELLTGVIVDDLFQIDIKRLELVKIGQQVENNFIGVNSGIMDQFAIGMGKKNQAILLDTNTLEYNYVPADFSDHQVIIMNTNKRRELADSKYNERRTECEKALQALQKSLPIHSLGELTEEQLKENQNLIPNDILLKRARHAVSENERTLQAEKALKENDLVTFGQLLNASHASLRKDYEVTGPELDTLVAAAQSQPGVLGARMTGAGFGGCAIALVNRDQTETFIENVGDTYKEQIGYTADFYPAAIDDGTRKL